MLPESSITMQPAEPSEPAGPRASRLVVERGVQRLRAHPTFTLEPAPPRRP